MQNEDRWAAHLPRGLTDARSELTRDGSLPGRWMRRWAERAAWPQLQDVDGTWITSEELEARSSRAAHALLRAGLAPGDRFVICGPTTAAFVIAYVAALRAGLVVVPVNPAFTEPEVARIVGDACPTAAAIGAPSVADWVRAASPQAVNIFGLDLTDLPGADRGSCGQGESGIDRADSDDPALLIYTSGTTGHPKGALLTHGNILSSATAVNLAWRWQPADRLVLALPLFHIHGLGVGVSGTLCAGASVALMARFDPVEIARRCTEPETSLFFGVPTMYWRLSGEGLARDLHGLRLFVSGSAPLPAALAERIASETGQIPLERSWAGGGGGQAQPAEMAAALARHTTPAVHHEDGHRG